MLLTARSNVIWLEKLTFKKERTDEESVRSTESTVSLIKTDQFPPSVKGGDTPVLSVHMIHCVSIREPVQGPLTVLGVR